MKNKVLKNLRDKKKVMKLFIIVLVSAIAAYGSEALYSVSAMVLDCPGPAATAAAVDEVDQVQDSDEIRPTKAEIKAAEDAVRAAIEEVREADFESDVSMESKCDLL